MLVQEYQRAKGLILRRCAHVLLHGEMATKRSELERVHGLRTLFIVKVDVTPRPVHVGFLGAIGIVLHPQRRAQRIQQLPVADLLFGLSYIEETGMESF